MFLTIWPWYGSYWIVQKSQKCIFEWSKEQKTRFLAVFLSLVWWINLMSHIVIVLNVCQHSAMLSDRKWSFKRSQKVHLWMIQSVKKEVFGHYPDFGVLDQLDIAYCDSTKCFLTIGNVTRSLRIIQTPRKCIFEWSIEPKIRFLAIFRSFVCWIDLILHILIVLNVF